MIDNDNESDDDSYNDDDNCKINKLQILESDENIPNLPVRRANRIKNQKYMQGKKIVIWNGKVIHCEHNRRGHQCSLCLAPFYTCEKCDFSCITNIQRDAHMTSDKHLLSGEELKQKQIESGKNATKIGDTVENYIDSILMLHPDLVNLKRIGNSANKFDTIIKLKGEDCFRGIQTKKMTKNKNSNSFYYNLRSTYFDDTIIVGVNIEIVFILLFRIEK